MNTSSSDPQGLDSTRYFGTGFFLVRKARPRQADLQAAFDPKSSQILVRRSKFALTNAPFSLECDTGAVHNLYSWVAAGSDRRTGNTVSLV